LALFRLFRF